MVTMNEIWTEKYRPKTLDDVVGQKHVTERLKAYVASRNMPHLLLTGPAGTGKTTCSLALAKEMFGTEWKGNFIELNASDERGIDVVRGKIKEFARTAPLGDADFKIIFMDEADALTNDAQAALRRTMEKYSGICRFILSCNYSSKIIDPIQSRCAVFRFKPLTVDDVSGFLNMIVEKENIDITEDAVKGYNTVIKGDMVDGFVVTNTHAAAEKHCKPRHSGILRFRIIGTKLDLAVFRAGKSNSKDHERKHDQQIQPTEIGGQEAKQGTCNSGEALVAHDAPDG